MDRTTMETKSGRAFYTFNYYLPIILLIIFWYMMGATGHIREFVFPSLGRLAETVIESTKSGILFQHILASLLRVLTGFAISASVGIVLGILTAISRRFYLYSDCIIKFLHPIPPIAWIPLAILMLGIGEPSKIFIIFLGGFFPVFTNTVNGIRQIEGRFVEVSEVLELPRSVFIRKVLLKGALPSIMTGLRVGIGSSWMCVVAAEMIAATRGIGYMLMDGRSLSRPDYVILGMLLIGIIGKLMNDLLGLAEKKVIYW